MDVVTSITSKDILLLIIGALITLPITAGWHGLKGWFRKRADATNIFQNEWMSRLTSENLMVREMAFRELIIRASYHFIMGNMMFAVSGIALIGDIVGFFPVQLAIIMMSSVFAATFFLLSAKWLNLYRLAYGFK